MNATACPLLISAFSYVALECLFIELQVWFQNRRMKDKRQRMAIAWPYAAVYTDPAFAASLLQAAASSLPLHYPPPPPVYTHPYPRYHPYQNFGLPQGGLAIPNLNNNIPLNPAMHQGIPTNIPHPQLPQGLNLNLGLDFPPYPKFEDHRKLSPISSPVRSEISLSPSPEEGLLIPARISPPTTQVPEKPKLFKPYNTEV